MRNPFAALKQKWANRSIGAKRKMWDSLYASGFGQTLELPREYEHYSTLVDLIVLTNKNKTVLDVCCGEGLLLDFLESRGYQKYVGFDFSEIALKNAAKRVRPNASFVWGLAESFDPEGCFDAIVFNESLYYLRDPMTVLRRYAAYLALDGLMMVSVFLKSESNQRLVREMSIAYDVAQTVVVTHGQDAWHCAALRVRR
jgi:SAM-dependent methyltransferase